MLLPLLEAQLVPPLAVAHPPRMPLTVEFDNRTLELVSVVMSMVPPAVRFRKLRLRLMPAAPPLAESTTEVWPGLSTAGRTFSVKAVVALAFSERSPPLRLSAPAGSLADALEL